jgi:hypothetical protein
MQAVVPSELDIAVQRTATLRIQLHESRPTAPVVSSALKIAVQSLGAVYFAICFSPQMEASPARLRNHMTKHLLSNVGSEHSRGSCPVIVQLARAFTEAL